jgi:hypothetical protein
MARFECAETLLKVLIGSAGLCLGACSDPVDIDAVDIDELGTVQQAVVADVHTEQYQVTSRQDLTGPTRIRLVLSLTNASGDNPIEDMYLRLVASGSTRTGIENLEDATAHVKLTANDFADANQIAPGSVVAYLSIRANGVENLSQVGWTSP